MINQKSEIRNQKWEIGNQIRAYFLGNEIAEIREFEWNGFVRIIMKESRNVYEVPMHMVTLKCSAKRPVQLPLAV